MAVKWFIAGSLVILLALQMPQTAKAIDVDLPTILHGMPIKDKLLFIVDFLGKDNHALLDQLEPILIAAWPILGFDSGQELFANAVLPWAINNLPNLLKNEEFLGILKIFIDEVNNHTITAEYMLQTGTKSDKINYLMMKLFAVLDYGGMAKDILVFKSVRDFFPYVSTSRQLNQQCYNDTMIFFDRLLAGDTWAFDMFDAIGKPTTGIRRGVMYFLGTYDQCMGVRASIPADTSLGQYATHTDQMFKGKYCRATFKPPESLIESIAGEHINHTFGIPMTLSWGMCLPDSCHAEDIEGLLNLGLLGSWFNISVGQTVCEEDEDFKGDKKAQVVIAILGAVVALVMISSTIEFCCLKRKSNGTGSKKRASGMYEMHSKAFDNDAFYEDLKQETKSNGTERTSINVVTEELKSKMNGTPPSHMNGDVKSYDHDLTMDSDLSAVVKEDDKQIDTEGVATKILRSFSIFTNIPVLITTDTKHHPLQCLYGIRFISMLWIMLGNTYIYAALSLAEVPVAVNLMDSFDIMERFTFQAVMTASLATDTFFMISGCLITYWFLNRIESEDESRGPIVWLKFYAGKYWKMTPPYMLVMITFVYLYSYLGHGPMWPEALPVAESCKTDWWKHLLYINNLYGNDGIEAQDQCMTWSWFLAATMQFYLITPILLVIMVFSKMMGFAVIGILAIAGIVSAGVKEGKYGGDLLTSREDGGAYWNEVFITPWCRVAAYCVGMCLGVTLLTFKKRIHKAVALLCWLLALCLGVFIVYCQYSKFVDGATPWTSAQQAAYEALSRPVWALCVAWVVFACQNSLAGPLNDFFSWPAFVPLSRLTFMVYLLNPVLMVLVVYTKRSLTYISDFDMAYLFVGHVVINYAAAFFACLAYDIPFRQIKRIVQGKELDTPF